MFSRRGLALVVAAAASLTSVAAGYEVTFRQVMIEGTPAETIASWAQQTGQVISSVQGSAEATAYLVTAESDGTHWEQTVTLGPSTFAQHQTSIFHGSETYYTSTACTFQDDRDTYPQCSSSFIWEYTWSNSENPESPLSSNRFDSTSSHGLEVSLWGVYTATLNVIDGLATTTEDQLAGWRTGSTAQASPTIHASAVLPVETSVQEVQPTTASEEPAQQSTAAQEQEETSSAVQPEETSIPPSQNERSSLLQDSRSTGPVAGGTPTSPAPSPTTAPTGSRSGSQPVLPAYTGGASGFVRSSWSWSACIVMFAMLRL
ncbi:hypothetical protein NX059_009381 [Plenodomus lindquistii]|nr:hypothetical protein NX059_009381 [Plenodomus lindquistii]